MIFVSLILISLFHNVHSLYHLACDFSGGDGQRQGSVEPGSGAPGAIESNRKRAASLSTPHRAVDVRLSPEDAAHLFRENRGVSQQIFILCIRQLSSVTIGILI